MDVRDAVEADADAMASVADAPTDAMRGLVHDRTVRVAVADDDPESLLGFVSYDAGPDAVHVTQLAGSPAVLDRLLEEPVRFARGEGMAVKLVVPVTETAARDAAERAGFDAVGPGPPFAGEETVTYRLETG